MEVKMTERQALLYEARKKKLFRAFIMTCMWGRVWALLHR